MKHILNARRTISVGFAFVFEGPVAIGRFLLMLAAISTLTMPLTQDLWTWDHFLRGGQDFETGMLTIVLILCLAVLLSQVCKKNLDGWFTVQHVLAFTFRHGELPGRSLVGASFVSRLEQRNGTAIDAYSLPLQI